MSRDTRGGVDDSFETSSVKSEDGWLRQIDDSLSTLSRSDSAGWLDSEDLDAGDPTRRRHRRRAESHATSRLTAASVAAAAAVPGREESVYDPKGRYRSGIPPKVPIFDGKRDPVIIKKWIRKVAVWRRLSLPYLPREEMGLRLWQDGLTGRAEEGMQDDD